MQRMQRWSVVLLLVIAVMTGFAVRAIADQPEWPVDRTIDTAQRETAAAFYDALNAGLEGASPDALAALLSPAFVDHATDTGETRSVSAFLDEVRAVSAGASPVQLESRSIEATGSAVVVTVRQTPAEPTEAAGLTIESGSPAEHVEVLRIERGTIVDRWAPAFSWLDVSTYDGKPLTMSSSAGLATMLVRVALEGSAEQSWESIGIGLVLVETGAVSMTLTDRYGATTVSRWETGEFVSIPGGAHARVRSADGKPASIELYLVTHVGAGDFPLPIQWEDDAAQTNARTVLWDGQLLWQGRDVTHQPVRLVLPPRGTVTLVRPAGSALLVGAAAAIEVSIPEGGIEVLGADRWPETMHGMTEIDAAHAASIEDDGTVTLTNPTDAPVAVVLISMERVSDAVRHGTPCPCPLRE